ncbi:hypothetical protein CMT52_16920 [Elizabethkingia anophelis]|nr:hypothetical protein [Elizabethkingia anophelis]MDV4026016.1 hypothetical protein [Elizabethkingia anophelis]
MKKERLDQEIKEIEKAELLEDFKVEELEQRFEMGWFKNGASVEGSASVSTGTGGTQVQAGATLKF